MKDINFYQDFNVLTDALQRNGAFLIVKDKSERVNIMTIGWATLGIVWARPVMSVFVRPVRYTYEIIEQSSSFTVSVPKGEKLGKQLMECGTKSGRDINKLSSLGIKLKEGKLADSMIIEDCDLFYECSIIETNKIDEKTLDQKVTSDFYPKRDFHSVYYGEVKHSYTSL